jgi:hypothetical protein
VAYAQKENELLSVRTTLMRVFLLMLAVAFGTVVGKCDTLPYDIRIKVDTDNSQGDAVIQIINYDKRRVQINDIRVNNNDDCTVNFKLPAFKPFYPIPASLRTGEYVNISHILPGCRKIIDVKIYTDDGKGIDFKTYNSEGNLLEAEFYDDDNPPYILLYNISDDRITIQAVKFNGRDECAKKERFMNGVAIPSVPYTIGVGAALPFTYTCPGKIVSLEVVTDKGTVTIEND